MELSTSSFSNEIDKSIQEEFSVSQAAIDEIKLRKERGEKPESISNEEIKKNDPILDTYKVLDDAIHGGMGSVWRVHHESWNTDLAMKRPQPRFFAEGSEARKEEFIRECENWINLGLHPNIVSCYYVREIGGVPTIFSEWMDNGSLKDRIKDGSLYEGTEEEVQERILDIAIQTARGLQYSHENNLIHQDVKPGNILLTKDWDAKVADFGLAKAQSQLTENKKPVSTGYTIQYCPREQAEGAPAEKWMDVYAWALTVLEMYAGKRLWETGAEAKELFDTYPAQCAHAIPDKLQTLLKSCLTEKIDGFDGVEHQILDIYILLTQKPYPVSEVKAAPDTAVSLNNRAVSMIDLGKEEVAKELLELAASKDSSSFICQYNNALSLWENKQIDYNTFKGRVLRFRDGTEQADKLTTEIEKYSVKEIQDYQWDDTPDYWEVAYYDPPGWRITPILRSNQKKDQPREKTILKWDSDSPQKRSFGCKAFLDENNRIWIEKESRKIQLPGEALLDISTDCKKALFMDKAIEENTTTNYFLTINLETNEIHRTDFYKPQCDGIYVWQLKYVGMDGKIAAAECKGLGSLLLIEARTGRSLGTILYPAEEGWFPGGKVHGFNCPDGPFMYVPSGSGQRTITLPQSDFKLPYLVARLKSCHEIRKEQEQLLTDFSAAKEAFERNDIPAAKALLEPYCRSGAIVHHEAALQLWTLLGKFFDHTKLTAVVPTSDVPVPDPAGYQPFVKEPWTGKSYKNRISNGVVKLRAECSWEEIEDTSGDYYCDMKWSLTGFDAADETHKVFYIPAFYSFVDHAFDTDPVGAWDTNLYMSFLQDGTLCWSQWDKGKLEDPAVQKSFPKGMIFCLPASVELQNTENGLRIDNLLFDDEFEGCYPLWDAEIIPGKKQNYRLIYEYGKIRENVVLPDNPDKSAKKNDSN